VLVFSIQGLMRSYVVMERLESFVKLYLYIIILHEKADIIWKYSAPQVNWLERKGFLKI